MSEELFSRFGSLPKADLLIEQFKDAPLDDKSRSISFLLSLASNVQLDIFTLRVVYDDLVEAAAPYMNEDDFDEAISAVTRQAIEGLTELAQDSYIHQEVDALLVDLEQILKESESDD